MKIDVKKSNIFPSQHELLLYSYDDVIDKNIKDEVYMNSPTCEKNIQTHLGKVNNKTSKYTLAYEIRPSRCQFKANGIAPTLTAKMGTGGNNVPVVVELHRKLTEKECLKIMGFPDSYKIGKGSQAYKQIGNSVVVPVITIIAQNLVEILKSEANK